jgi:hypothetical protein
LVIVPPGGGEADYWRRVTAASHIPTVGEYIQEVENDGRGKMYRVNLVRTDLRATPAEDGWTATGVVVLAEPVQFSKQSARHERMVDMYKQRGKPLEEYPETGY